MRPLFALLAIILFGFTAAPALATTEDAKAFISKTGEDALNVIRNDSLPDTEKQKQLEQMFVQTVDLNWVSRFVLGKYARQVTPEQMTRYQKEYETFVVKHYTSHFTEYTGETLNILGARDEGDNEYVVNTEIQRPRQQSLTVDYRVRGEGNGNYRIIDIVFEGVSMITTQRSEFSSVVGRQGMDYLIQQLVSRNAQVGLKPSAADLTGKASQIQ